MRGRREGTRLGFPTANISLANEHASGVYGGSVTTGDKIYPAALYVGKNRKILEAHLLGFDGDLYEKQITVAIGKKIRERKDFQTETDLVAQIRKDIAAIRKFLQSYKA